MRKSSAIFPRKRFFVTLLAAAAILPLGMESRAFARGSLREVFARPLIIGASVSAGEGSVGPGTVATMMVMGANTATNIARNGAEGAHFAHLNSMNMRGYSAIIGVDFLFWDSTHADISASSASLVNLIRSARAARVPLVLGDIPYLSTEQNDQSRRALNQQIHSYCRPSQQCYVLGVDALHRTAVTRGIRIGGYLYHFSDLTTDNLHLNQTGSNYLARILIRVLGGR